MSNDPRLKITVGMRSEYNLPFMFGVTAKTLMDIPEKCIGCPWVVRGDGLFHLKYPYRLCRVHGGLL